MPQPARLRLQDVPAAVLDSGLGVLTDRQREVITRRIDGQTYRAITAVLGIGHNSVRAMEQTALKRLRAG